MNLKRPYGGDALVNLTLRVEKKSEGRRTVRTNDRIEFQILAKIIKKLRVKAKISQRGLGIMIGRHHSYMGKFEHGEVYPELPTILDMLEVLEVEPGPIIDQVFQEAKRKRDKSG